MKQWRTTDEWKIYAGCGDAGDEFITEEGLPYARLLCDGCPVRPECIKWALDEETGRGIHPSDSPSSLATEVVVAGVWIPSAILEDDTKNPEWVVSLDILRSMLQNEYDKRGDY